MQAVSVAIKHLETALQQAGATSDLGKAVLDSLTKLSKITPPGSVSPAAQRNEMDSAMRKNMQQQQMMKQMQGGGGGGQGGPPGMPPGGGQAQPPGGMGMAA